MMIEASNFRRVLGNYPTGVSVITAMTDAGMPAGMVVGTFTSVSLDPPLVGFFPDRNSSSWKLIEPAGRFCVNVLAADQTDLCRQLAVSGADKFNGVDFALSRGGCPVLPGVVAWIDCTLEQVVEAGDHYLVLGRVTSLDTGRETGPMLFFQGQYGCFSG
jgi:flavin reductase (DIM6/NTAB) family NADH-FMN oxidoreductase RutF